MIVRTSMLLLLAMPLDASAVLPGRMAQFAEQHCYDCHDADAKEGGLDLTGIAFEPANADALARWVQVFDRVKSGEMPPKQQERPEADAQAEFLATLGGSLHEADANRIATAGRVPARRLTRFQFERSLHELLGIDIPLANLLPEEARADGFDTVSAAQQVSHQLLEKYLAAVDLALDEAFERALGTEQAFVADLGWPEIQAFGTGRQEPEPREAHRDAVVWPSSAVFAGRMPSTIVRESGWYRLTVRVAAVNPPASGEVWCSVRSGLCYAPAPTLFWIGSFTATAAVREHTFEAWIEAGHMVQLRPLDSGLPRVTGRRDMETTGSTAQIERSGMPGVAIKALRLEKFHCGPAAAALRERLLGGLVAGAEPAAAETRATVARLVRDFADRAFRAPVTADEAAPYVALAEAEFGRGGDVPAALRAAYRGVLSSPRFLYFEEAAGVLPGHAVAARLSYFLWSVPPDEELRAAAARLHEPAERRAQVERMLADPRAAAFVANFTDQWLNLSDIDFTTPDAKLYPEFDEVLKHAMLEETRVFFRELIDRDLGVAHIVDSPFGLMNSRLARHYGLLWPGGEGVQSVPLSPADKRGGLITHASVLKVTANGTTTSPVIRGVWMLERILGQEVPPVPANVPAIEPDIRGAQTIREQLDKHRNSESCASCHVKIDPPGFALESYDVIGGWRDHYRAAKEGKDRAGKRVRNEDITWSQGPAVDPGYTLADGRSFADLAELKKLLLSDPDSLARNFAAKLITYATGAGISFSDREVVEGIVAKTRSKDHGLRSILHEVVESRIFLNK